MINWNRRKYSQEQFRDAWEKSLSIAEVADKLGCNKNGGGYQTLRSTAEELGLSREHMTGSAWNVGERFRPVLKARPMKDILVYGKYENSSHLRTRLIREGIKAHNCEKCLLSEWMGLPIPLELDHINGNRKDHRIENLKLLCPNCHAQTWNYCGRGKSKNK